VLGDFRRPLAISVRGCACPDGTAIAERRFVTDQNVEKHVKNIFGPLTP
jgi:hypothetical protein